LRVKSVEAHKGGKKKVPLRNRWNATVKGFQKKRMEQLKARLFGTRSFDKGVHTELKEITKETYRSAQTNTDKNARGRITNEERARKRGVMGGGGKKKKTGKEGKKIVRGGGIEKEQRKV